MTTTTAGGFELAMRTLNAMRREGWRLDRELRLVDEEGRVQAFDVAEVALFLGVLPRGPAAWPAEDALDGP